GRRVPDFFSLAYLPGDSVNGFVGMIFRKRAVAPVKIVDELGTYQLIGASGLLSVRVERGEKSVEARLSQAPPLRSRVVRQRFKALGEKSLFRHTNRDHHLLLLTVWAKTFHVPARSRIKVRLLAGNSASGEDLASPRITREPGLPLLIPR